MNQAIFDLLAIAPWVLCPSLVLLGLSLGVLQVLRGLGHVTSGFFALAPDWEHWAQGHKGYVERQGGRISLRCTLSGQHFELELPDGGGQVHAQLTLDPPPLWIQGNLSDRTTLGPDWIQVGELRAPVTWDHACRVQLRIRVDQLMGAVEEICTALCELEKRLTQDRLALSAQHFTPQPKPNPRAPLACSPNGAEPTPNPGAVLSSWASGADRLALSSFGWGLELSVVSRTAFEITEGAGGGLGQSVVDMLLCTQGTPPKILKDPILAQDLLWLLHGHPGTLNQQHLRVWLAPGELGEGIERAMHIRDAMSRSASPE